MLTNKIWLYSVNFTLIISECFLFFLGKIFFSHPWIRLFPLGWQDTVPQIYLILMAFQIIACFCGLFGTCTTRIPVLKIFWILMISLVCLDVAMISPIAKWMSSTHKKFALDVSEIKIPNCTFWREISTEMDCCPDLNIIKRCRAIGDNLPRCAMSSTSCTRPLLQWLHFRADHLALLIYFFLLPLKCLVVFVLREDIRRIFFIQVVSGDYDEEEDEYFPTQRRFREFSVLKEVQSAPQRLYGA